MSNSAEGISPEENELIIQSTSGILDENVTEPEEDENKRIENGVAILDDEKVWVHDGIIYKHEDIAGNFELIDMMPMGLRNVILTGNEIAEYLEWKEEQLEEQARKDKIEEARRRRTLIAAMGGKKPPTLDEWLGRDKENEPDHTETDDKDLDWGDIM